jgi:hypothetical protein
MQLATPTFVPAAYAMNASKSFLRHIGLDNSSINNNLCGCTTSASTSFSQSAEVLSDNNTVDKRCQAVPCNPHSGTPQ